MAPNTAENAGEVFAPYKTKQKEVGIKFDLGAFAHTLSVYEIKRPGSYTDPVTNVFRSAASSATGAWNGACSARPCAACA